MAEQFDAYHEWLGIPSKDQPPTYYRLLGVDEGESNLRVIENAADRQMAHVRTFQTGKHAAISQKLLNQIAAAKVCLLNVEKKVAYDAQLAAKSAAKTKLSADSAARVAKPVAAPSVGKFAASLPGTSAPNATLAELEAVIDRSPHRKTVRRKSLWQRPTILGGAAVALLTAVGAVYFALMPPAQSTTDDARAQAVAVLPPTADSPAIPNRPDSTQPSSDVDNANAAGTISEVHQTSPAAVESVIPQPQTEVPTAQNAQGRQRTEGSTPADDIPNESMDAQADMEQTGGIELPSVADDDKPDSPEETPDSTSRKSPVSKPALTRRPTPSTSATVQKSQKVVNLLKLIDLRRDRFGGELKCDGKTLSSAETLDGDHQLQIPYRPGAREYQLTIVAEPVSGQPVMNVGLYGGNTQCVVSLHNVNGTLSHVAGNYKDLNGLPRDLFLRGKQTTLTFVVRSEGFQVLVAGQPIVQQVGYQMLSSNQQWNGPDSQALAIGWNFGAFRISKLELRVLKQGAAPEQPIANLVSARPQQFLVATDVPQNRDAVPSADDQTRALDQVRDVFKAEFAKAKKPDEKIELSEKLLQQGIDTQDDVAASYVLLKESRDLSAAAGNLSLAVRCVETLTERFEINRFDALQQAVAEVAKHTSTDPAARLAVVEAALELMNAAAAEGRFDVAGKLATTASGMSAKLKDAALKKRVQAALADVKKQKTQFAAIQELKDKLATSPDDADANLKLGKHLCLVQGDWDKGLSHLAKGGDEKYAPLAQQEMTKPDSAEAQVKLADAWWDLSASEPAASKPALMTRAGQWYQIVLPAISGLGKVKIEKRLEQIGAVEQPQPAEPVTAATSVSARTGPKVRVSKSNVVESPLFGRTDKMAAGDLDRHIATALVRNRMTVAIAQGPDDQNQRYLNNGQEVPPGDVRVCTISFYGNAQVSNADLEPVGRLENLRDLSLKKPEVSDAGLALLARTKSLRALRLGNMAITDRGTGSIGGIPSLISLELSRMPISDAGIARIAALPQLHQLTLEELSLTAAGVKSLGKLQSLQYLYLRNIQLNDNQLAPLASLPNLENIHFDQVPATGDWIRLFKQSTRVSTLELNKTRLNEQGLKHIGALQSLRYLTVADTTLSESGLKQLSGLIALQGLTLSRTQLTDRMLPTLSSLRGLAHFSINDESITGTGFRKCGPFELLNGAFFSKTRVNDEGLKCIVAAMPNLMNISIADSEITDAGMKHFAGLTKLSMLMLHNSKITDKGVLELKALGQLQHISLPRGIVSAAAVEKLQAALPRCNINLN